MAIPAIGSVNMTILPSFLNLARTNLYQVYITPQWGTASDATEQNFLTHLKKGASRYGVINFQNDFSNTLVLLCSEATIPTSSYATAEVKDNFMGVPQEFAHTRINTDIDFTFYIDRQYKVLGFFEAWMDFISGGSELSLYDNSALSSGNYYRRFNYHNFYKNKGGIYIKKFEKDWQTSNAPSISFQLINAFPKSVSSLSVSYGESELLKVTVTMNYDRYIVRREYAPVVDPPGSLQGPDLQRAYAAVLGPEQPTITINDFTQ